MWTETDYIAIGSIGAGFSDDSRAFVTIYPAILHGVVPQ